MEIQLLVCFSVTLGEHGPGAIEETIRTSCHCSPLPKTSDEISAHEQVSPTSNLCISWPGIYLCFGFLSDVFGSQVWGDWDDACDEQVHVSARHRAHVGHAYLSLSAVRYYQLHWCFVIATLFYEVLLLHHWFFCFVGGETSLWDLTMSNSTQGPTLEHLQKVCNM